jgi:hypothetical protein
MRGGRYSGECASQNFACEKSHAHRLAMWTGERRLAREKESGTLSIVQTFA